MVGRSLFNQYPLPKIKIMKRQKRRHRHALKQQLRRLDEIAKKRIHQNYNLFFASWGGTRCPGCGITIRPHKLIGCDFSGCFTVDGKTTGHISGFTYPCNKVKKCPGERDWE